MPYLLCSQRIYGHMPLPMAECPIWVRVIFSTAAPLFIFLSGVSISFAEEAHKPIKTLLKRIFQVLIIGVVIDVFVWQIVPFYNFDVLYLISFSLLIIIGIGRIPKILQILITAGLLISNVFLLDVYNFEIMTIELSGNILDFRMNTALHQFFIDGWFPLLPWSGIACSGYLLTKYRNELKRFNVIFLSTGVFLLILSMVLYQFNYDNIQPLRDGYAELFYPVKNYFWILLFGIMLSMVPVINSNISKTLPLSDLGKKSLFLYLLHTIIIAYIIPFIGQETESINWGIALVTFFGFYALLIAINHFIKPLIPYLKNGKYKIIGFLIGF